MTEYIQTAILGIVQGLTEFLPISSSGHLILIRQALGFPDQGLTFDAVLHLATALAVLVYFWQDWKNMFNAVFTRRDNRVANQSRRLVWLIVITTIPAIIAGLLFASQIENKIRGVVPVASLMIFTGLMIWLVEKMANLKRDITKLTWLDALSIGLAQAVAILPGISRSGATILAGMYHGIKREAAARYSFLAAGPIVVLAGSYSFWQMLKAPEPFNIVPVAIGFVAAFLSGLAAIHLLISFLKTHRLTVFGKYLIIVGAGLIIINSIW